ncbi:hypothetical protein PIB30_086418 [Stylosanthes scabra]|uniref:Uncharacterized protein n=1 Tax=Stylosanthes scabra TaxID=79078 RepID=A0ABU6QUC1_9FABA|nr:hypothetical protein [Stylosanthes scabra]
MFLIRVAARKNGELDMDLVYQEIRRPETNWANNPVDNTILDRKTDNIILNTQATAWHKLIIANIDPKQHGTTFDLNHAILIYVLMTKGVVLFKRPTRNSRDWKGEQPKVHRGRLIPPSPAPSIQQAEQHPPFPPPQPATSEIPSSSVLRLPDPSLRKVMRYLHRPERFQLYTQSMLRDAFPDTTFRNLLPVTSSEDDSDAES